MKTTLVLILAVVLLAACGGASPEVSNTPSESSGSPSRGDLETVTAHSADRGEKVPGGSTGWSRGGDPIDTSVYDAEIAKAEKDLKGSPDSAALKQALSAAYFKRGEALTQARQYASALGDYRKALKADPNNSDAEEWIGQIIAIYTGMNKDYPKEGEEPPPLEFKKGSAE